MTAVVAIESLIVVDDTSCYTEAYLYDDGSIGLHVEDGGPEGVEPTYTLEQAEALHRTLGHLLYLARQD
jgi:hypothetical protein